MNSGNLIKTWLAYTNSISCNKNEALENGKRLLEPIELLASGKFIAMNAIGMSKGCVD
jgi:hypothetical protein